MTNMAGMSGHHTQSKVVRTVMGCSSFVINFDPNPALKLEAASSAKTQAPMYQTVLCYDV
jgi:hypothetical protein